MCIGYVERCAADPGPYGGHDADQPGGGLCRDRHPRGLDRPAGPPGRLADCLPQVRGNIIIRQVDC